MKGLRYIFGDTVKAVLMGFLGIFCLAACHKDLPGGPAVPEEEPVTVEFRLGFPNATRMTGVTDSDESKVDRWVLYIYTRGLTPVGDPVVVESSDGVSAAEKTVVRTLKQGQHRIQVVCNYPTSGNDAFNPSDYTDWFSLRDKKWALVSNARDRLIMVGNMDKTFSAGDNETLYINVSRPVAKAEVTNICVNMSEDSWKAKTFVLKKIYLTNVCTCLSTSMNSDWFWARNMWYNTMGYHTPGSGYFNGSEAVAGTSAAMDALTGDDAINTVIPADGGTYETAHAFYFCPNPVSEASDQPGAPWGFESGESVYHRTRLVLECTLDGITYFYTISLPPSSSNNSYIASDVTITRPGSTNPEVEIPGAVTVTWATAADDWDGPYTVTENS